MLQPLAENLYVVDRPQRFLGAEIGTRMTVVRLREGGLFVHSPVSLDPELRKALDALGPVRFVVAPNRFHHLYAGEYTAQYPQAELFVAPGLETKRKDLRIDGVLGDEAPAGWAGQIEQIAFRGMPIANEVVFFHRGSRTLLISDLAFNIGPESPARTRFSMWLMRGYGRFGPSLVERLAIRDRPAARASLERILAWDFDRVIMAHGRVLESGGREGLRSGYAWLLPEVS